MLSLPNASGAQAFLRAVSSPGSATFHHYLTDAQWVSQFGPTQAEVAAAESWLHQEGFTVGSVPKDRLYVPASGSAKSVAQAFGVTLGYYMVNGHKVRLAKSTLTIPSSLAGVVSGVVGVNQNVDDHQPGAARRPPGSAIPSHARRTGGRRSTPRTRPSSMRPTPLRCPTTSAATSPLSSEALTSSPGRWPRVMTAVA